MRTVAFLPPRALPGGGPMRRQVEGGCSDGGGVSVLSKWVHDTDSCDDLTVI